MSSYFPEVFFRRALATHLHTQGFQVREEVLFGNSRFDIVAYAGGKILGFEVKISSWSRAIEQSRIYKLCCDEVFLAIPSNKLSDSVRNRCLIEGVGLVTIGPPPDWKFDEVLQAYPSPLRNPGHYASIQRIAAFK